MAVILDGKKLREKIIDDLAVQVAKLEEKPCLAVVIVGDDSASKVYVSHKKKACAKIGIESLSYELSEDTSEADLLKLVDDLNMNDKVNGILVQLPLPAHINEAKVIKAIDPIKDVDGFHPVNVGNLLLGGEGFISCTPKGIITLLKEYGIDLKGKNCTVVGRSNIVGKPVSALLTREDATVTIAHSKTRDLKELCRKSELIVAAIGKEKFITAEYVAEGAVVVDVGINRDKDGKLCGDVDFENVKDKASYITPVPGGVGPMTIASLMENLLLAYELQKGENE